MPKYLALKLRCSELRSYSKEAGLADYLDIMFRDVVEAAANILSRRKLVQSQELNQRDLHFDRTRFLTQHVHLLMQ